MDKDRQEPSGLRAGVFKRRLITQTQIVAKPINGRHCLFPVAVRRQRSEQYLTLSQSRSHFLRQVNGRRQVRQFLLGRLCLLTPRIEESFDIRSREFVVDLRVLRQVLV